MKIIKSGNLNRIVTCESCGCVYEFDKNDIQIGYGGLYTGVNYNPYKYVVCPECGELHYIYKPDSITINGGIHTEPVVRTPEVKLMEKGE